MSAAFERTGQNRVGSKVVRRRVYLGEIISDRVVGKVFERTKKFGAFRCRAGN